MKGMSYKKFMLEIIQTLFLNWLKQFMLRLLSNKFFLGKRAQKLQNPETSMCYLCQEHIEKRIPIFFHCEMVKNMTQYLVRVLKKSRFLKKRNIIGLFLFHYYNFITIENLPLTMLWNYVYN